MSNHMNSYEINQHKNISEDNRKRNGFKKFLTRCHELGIMSPSRAGYGNLLNILEEDIT